MTQQDYQASASAYAEELRGLFAPPMKATRSGQPAGLSTDELADRADRLAELSSDLIRQTAGFLQDEDSAVRLGAEQHLLAQAAASLSVVDGLLAAAADAGETEMPEATRSMGVRVAGFDELLSLLETPLAEAGAIEVRMATRGAGTATAAELVATANETLEDVLTAVAEFGQDALVGLLGLDVALLKQAAGMVSEELGQAIEGISQQASRLVARAVTFLIQAYDSLLAALGQEATGELRQKAAEWIQRLQEGEAMAALLARVLQVSKMQEQVQALVDATQALEPVLGQTREAVAALPAGYQQRTKLAGQILAGLGVIKRFPIARVPVAELASAVAYITLFGFVVYAGADYVDAPALERLGRVPGVLHVVESGLAGN